MNWAAVAPEIVLLTMACVIALVDLFVTDAQRGPTFWLTQASLAAVALLHLARLDSAERSMRCRAWSCPTRWATCWPSSPPWR